MSNLKDFDWTGFWNDVDYAFESYIGKPVTNKAIKDAEIELGYTLPAAYIELLNNHNGGVLNKNCFINNDGECVYVTGIYGIDRDKKNSIFGEFGNEFWISKWEYPPIGVVVADTISGGHDMIFLDYRECGPTDEPKVVRVDQEGDYSITLLADSFGDFIKQLYISIEDITDEEFQALSDEDKVKLINEQEDLDIDRAMELLTNIGIDNLSPILLGILGRIYNNNDKPEEAIKVLNSLDEEYRDAVWHYRCAYSYGFIASSNNEAYTSNNMQHMLALVDNGIRLAVSENRNNIIGYFFEIIDMCYMQIDFERCESDYPELCSAYSKYVAKKQKNRRGVPQERTITVEEIKETDDMWTINEPAYWTINIYGSYDDYIETSKEFTLEQRYLNAICWYFAEVNNGGHHQFLYNSTGIVWEDALAGLRLFKMDELADNLQSVIDYFGGSVPFDRAERWTILQDWENEEKLFDFLDGKDDVVYEYDGIFEDAFVHENPQLFVFDGTYTIPE